VQAADRAAIIVALSFPELDIHKLFLIAEEILRGPSATARTLMPVKYNRQLARPMPNDGNHHPSTEITTQESFNPGLNESKSLISPEKLRQLYASMLKCRILSKTLDRLSDSRSRPKKEEASKVGCAIDLMADDVMSSSPTDYSAHLLAAVPVNYLLQNARLQRKLRRSRKLSTFNFRLPSSKMIPATRDAAFQISLGTGIGLQFQRQKKDSLVLVFCPGMMNALDQAEEALVFAGAHRLPVIFVVQEHATRNSSVGRSVNSVDPYGFPSIPVDGSDAIAVYRVAFESMYKARIGEGPTLIVCKYDHNSPDPLLRAQDYLRKKSLWSDEFAMRVADNFSRELRGARTPRVRI
jgi:TPP-dependent pyruvate/acetoin dehydrogenase alpha subunit